MKDTIACGAVIIFVIAAVATVTFCTAYGEESGDVKETPTMRGIVGSVDWVGSVLVVDSVRFSVSEKTEVYKGNGKIWFSEINVGDPVSVIYYKDDEGILRAVRITVEYSGNLPV